MEAEITPVTNKHTTKQLRIAIIGAGIGGLAAAVALSRLIPEGLVKVDVYEQAREVKEIGTGIAFWTRTWPIFRHLGVAEELEKHLERKLDDGGELNCQKVIKGDQSQWRDIFEGYKNGQLSPFHRATVQKILLDSLPPSVEVHLNHRLASYDESDECVQLKFDNQDSQICDLLVAADGIKSRVREAFISKRLPDQQRCINPVWGGTTAYRSLINAEKLKQAYPEHVAISKPMVYTGASKFAVSYPIMQGRFIVISANVTEPSKEGTQFVGPTSKPTEKDYVLSLYSGWSDEYLGLLKCADSYNQWTIQYLSPLPSFAVGRVALLGDAAHAMTPTLGSGAGQAVEDAYTLSHLVLKAVENKIPIHCVTEAYTKSRQPLANLVLQKSDELGRLITFRSPGYEDINKADEKTVQKLLEQFKLDYEGKFNWWETHPVEKEIEKALDMLQQFASQS